MIVLAASAAVDWLLQTPAGERIENRIYAHGESLHAPGMLDLEVAQGLRRLAREGTISVARALGAIEDIVNLRVSRYPHWPMLPRIWQLPAAYIVLAEKLGATLLTCDPALASAAGHAATVEVV